MSEEVKEVKPDAGWQPGDGDELEGAVEKATVPESHRSGTWVTGCMQFCTAVVGAGVLALPHAVSVTGWLGGFVALFCFLGITKLTTTLLAEVSQVNGVRQTTFGGAVFSILGEGYMTALTIVQMTFLPMAAIGYSVTAALVLRDFTGSYCEPGETCMPMWQCALIFGASQVIISQVPNLDSLAWMSVVGALMSFGYSMVAVGLSISIGAGATTSVGGIVLPPVDKMWAVLNALGLLASAYLFTLIQVEIFDTIKTDAKGPVWHIKRTVDMTLFFITIFYIMVIVTGYIAFGDNACGNIITCFTQPVWVIRMVNMMVLVHMLPAYQVYSQPFFGFVTRNAARWGKYPAVFQGLAFRLWFRTLFVLIVTVITVLIPFFSDIIGAVGAVTFFPSVFFPIQMWKAVYQPQGWKLHFLNGMNVVTLLVSIVALAGSIQLIVKDSGDYKIFG